MGFQICCGHGADGISTGSGGGVLGGYSSIGSLSGVRSSEEDEFLQLTLSSPSRSSTSTTGEKVMLLSTVTDPFSGQ